MFPYNVFTTSHHLTMELKDQLTPLLQARRLDELGFKENRNYSYTLAGDRLAWWAWSFWAYSVSELMDALPYELYDWEYTLRIFKILDMYSVWYGSREKPIHIINNENLAEALSDMLIRLIENNLLPQQQ